MTGDLAPAADPHALLDFHKSADLGVIANLAPIEIGEGEYFDPLPKLHVRSNALKELFAAAHAATPRNRRVSVQLEPHKP